MPDTLIYDIPVALGNLSPGAPLQAGTKALLNVLGYSSERTADVGSVTKFLQSFASDDQLTEKRRQLFESWVSVEIVFQLTDKEIKRKFSYSMPPGFDQERIKSFLFLAVDMKDASSTRTYLTEATRAVNRLFKMPVIILFRHGLTLTLAITHRRPHMRDDGRDVLEGVTLVKDIHTETPHRAHIEILADLALSRIIKSGAQSFDELHVIWEQTLDIEALNKRFYNELFAWFEWAVDECTFPDDGAGEGCNERHVIRLITRLLFVWFLKEKDSLIPDELFNEEYAREALKKYNSSSTDYYRAVLQNLFFATLNTEIDKRAFSDKSHNSHRNLTKYRYRSLLSDPDRFVKKLQQVPFVNGGLFDCLDDFAAANVDERHIDVFTDNKTHVQILHVPAHLFFDPQNGLFPLFGRYKFTVEENTPLDREVALDPELLGRVFENLLAAYNPETRETARKVTGSYYTPRPVVDYMVREALTETLSVIRKSANDDDITFWRERLEYLFDHSDAMDDADQLFEETEKYTIMSAIAGIRTLDPAVGSGAFPMGVLQILTLALRRLDPENVLWEKIQKERAKARAGDAFEVVDQNARDEVLNEISDTFEKYRKSDFGRKLYLIQNGIYGVDIQPIACQITKLRFFISLTIEQSPDLDEPNLGIKPLPNLETQFVAADTLISLKTEVNSLPFDDARTSKRKEVEAMRERYFLADNREDKIKCIEMDKTLRDELQDMLEKERQNWRETQERSINDNAKRLPNPDTQKKYRESKFCELDIEQRAYDAAFTNARMVAEWDPFDQNSHTNWFDAEWMFGVSDGFDIVIGNPPYIQLQKDGGKIGEHYNNSGYKTFAKTGDIYQLFYERGCRLLKSHTGVLAYITSNSWLKAKYGKHLRRWFADNHTPLSLIELGKDVFENAIVDTAVLIVRSDKSQSVTCQAVDIEQVSNDQFPPPKRDWGTLQPDGERPWMALSHIERSVMEKMEAVGTPLKDWDISIYRGILTGYNPAFIVDQATRDALVADDPRSTEILKPVLRGRDIARYRANWAGLWLISTFPSLNVNIDAYPAIKKHLLSFGQERLAQEGRQLPDGHKSRKKTSHAWYELQDTCAYHKQFSEEKLFWMDLTSEGRFSYAPAESEIFCVNTVYFMHGPMMKCLAGFLNSSLITWYVNKTSVTSGMGVARWIAMTVEEIPIPLTIMNSNILEDLVDDLIIAKGKKLTERIAKLERAIESFVYQAFDITETQRDAIRMVKIG